MRTHSRSEGGKSYGYKKKHSRINRPGKLGRVVALSGKFQWKDKVWTDLKELKECTKWISRGKYSRWYFCLNSSSLLKFALLIIIIKYYYCAHVLSRFILVWLFATPWTAALQALCPWDSPGRNTGMGSHFLLQEIFQNRNQTFISCIACGFFSTESPGTATCILCYSIPVIWRQAPRAKSCRFSWWEPSNEGL